MRVFISVDMEGMAGVVHLHQVMRGMPEYERSCRWMTAETNAAVAGARRAGPWGCPLAGGRSCA